MFFFISFHYSQNLCCSVRVYGFVRLANVCLSLIESKMSWNVIPTIFFLFVPGSISVSYVWFFQRWTITRYISLLSFLTRRVSLWFLFISITHHTSITLRSGRDRGVKMTECARFLFFFFFVTFAACTLEKSIKVNLHCSLLLLSSVFEFL